MHKTFMTDASADDWLDDLLLSSWIYYYYYSTTVIGLCHGGKMIKFDDDLTPFGSLQISSLQSMFWAIPPSLLQDLLVMTGSLVASYCALIRPDLFKSVVIMPFTGTPFQKPIWPPLNLSSFFLTTILPFLIYLESIILCIIQHQKLNWDHWHAKVSCSLHANQRQHRTEWRFTRSRRSSRTSGIRLSIRSNRWSLNWYRCLTDPKRLVQDTLILHGKQIKIPAMSPSGARDWGVYQFPGAENFIRNQNFGWGILFWWKVQNLLRFLNKFDLDWGISADMTRFANC